MNTAIIVAAGSGTRFGAEKPKQFLEIGGKPLLIHTLERFENCPAIDRIVLVLAAGEKENFQNAIDRCKLEKIGQIAAGGKTRAESVFHGLQAIETDYSGIVAVHDGARPFVTCEEICAAIAKAGETGAACLVAPVTDTIKEVADGKIVGTVDRTRLRRALTPQCFRIDILRAAFSQADLSESATDECFLVERAGFEISYVDGSAKNIKITTREDWEIAEMLLQ